MEDVRLNPRQLDGFNQNGPGIVVEIDKSYFFRRKFHRGRRVNGISVFAAIERDSGLCMQVVPDRTVQTLVPIIQQWCLPGTHIISDGWAVYKNLALLKGDVYLHDVVVQQNFVDPLHPELHTQNCDNLWMH